MYKRDPKKVSSYIKELEDGYFCTAPFTIQVPENFETKGLLKIEKKIQVFGLFALILEDDTYALINANTMITINPYKHNIIKVDGESYYQFHFYKDSLIIPTRNTVKDDLLIV